MALGSFITALKVVPWADVISAAPAIVKGARKIFTRAEEPAPVVPPGADQNERLRLLETRVQEMAAREQESVKVIAALAEQNAAVVDALGVLRARARWLVGINAVLLVLLAAGLVVSCGRFGGG